MAEDDQRPPQEGEAFYDDGWTEEDEERYQARRQQEVGRTRRRRRQGASFAVLVLLVLGIGLAAGGIYAGWWQWPFDDEPAATAEGGQPCPTPTVTAAPVEQVTVRVLNSTDTRGLAATVAAELQARGMTVLEIGNDEAEVAETAQVRHGPEAVAQARTVAAQFPGVVVVDDGRPGPDVDVSLGAAFTVLAPPEEAAAALVPAPAESPAGCVPATPATPADPAATPTG